MISKKCLLDRRKMEPEDWEQKYQEELRDRFLEIKVEELEKMKKSELFEICYEFYWDFNSKSSINKWKKEDMIFSLLEYDVRECEFVWFEIDVYMGKSR